MEYLLSSFFVITTTNIGILLNTLQIIVLLLYTSSISALYISDFSSLSFLLLGAANTSIFGMPVNIILMSK